MAWSALIGAFIGAGIPATLAYLGLHRQRQSADAEAFGPAVLLLDRISPDRLIGSSNPDRAAETAMLADLQLQVDAARGRLLVVAASSPRRRVRKLARIAEIKLAAVFRGSSWAVRDMYANRNNPEWIALARERHAEAMLAVETLIEANFAWTGFDNRLRAIHAVGADKAGSRPRWTRRHDSSTSAKADQARAEPGANKNPAR